jgi:hypothetical protein
MTEPTTTDRRGYPRIPATFPVKVLGEDGAELAVRTIDIAPGGLKLECDKLTAYGLSRRVGRIAPEQSPDLRIQFDLPLSSGSVRIDTRCRMIYLYLQPEDDVVILGVEFMELPGESFSAIEQFMEQSVSPA